MFDKTVLAMKIIVSKHNSNNSLKQGKLILGYKLLFINTEQSIKNPPNN